MTTSNQNEIAVKPKRTRAPRELTTLDKAGHIVRLIRKLDAKRAEIISGVPEDMRDMVTSELAKK